MPMPVSVTLKVISISLSAGPFFLQFNGHLALFGKLNGVVHQVYQYLAKPVLVAYEVFGDAAVGNEFYLQVFSYRFGIKRLPDVLRQVMDVERRVIEHQFARFYLIIIKNIVDNSQQVFAAKFKGVEVL
jgi:hypothetical protein